MNWDWEKLREQQQRQQTKVDTPFEVPPQMDDFIKQVKNIKQSKGITLIIVFLLVVAGFSTFFTVGVDEVGIVQRFGKYVRTCQPGLNFKYPAGIEKVTLVKIKRIYKEEFGFQSSRSFSGNRFAGEKTDINASMMLTGDLNVAIVPWIVQYRIKDPYNYLFKVKDVQRLLRDLSESSMRLVVGDRSINEVISKREEIAVAARKILQKELNIAQTGIYITTIEMKKTNVPAPVQPSFNEVNQAIQEKEKLIYQAKEGYNKAIPAALGEAQRTVKMAEGYALDRLNRAEGDTSRFTSVYNEYVKAKDITKRRMYLDMLGNVFPKLGKKYIIDSDEKNFLPLLNMSSSGEKGGIVR
ncbi:MAG: HflK protein [Desulfobacteraceae bacterium 4572_19]|nr:MAG: HflK protein [Desulfobacteraceae bacterium 4572_19]